MTWAEIRAAVRTRAGDRCEYCRFRQELSELPFQIEHITARQHGGLTELDNLALACRRCNLHKGPNLAGIDPRTGLVETLFHPRRQVWRDHFRLDGEYIRGLSPTGRATAAVLKLNEPRQLALRRGQLAAGLSLL